MNWIKVTPETMPPENKRVILTTKNPDGSKTTDIAKWCGEKLGWMILLPGFHPSTLADEAVMFEITHWTPYPEPAEDCKTEEDCISTPHLIDATTSRDIDSGRYPVYVLGFGVSEDDLTDDERKLWEQSKRWRNEDE